jgi:hypothetical protein
MRRLAAAIALAAPILICSTDALAGNVPRLRLLSERTVTIGSAPAEVVVLNATARTQSLRLAMPAGLQPAINDVTCRVERSGAQSVEDCGSVPPGAIARFTLHRSASAKPVSGKVAVIASDGTSSPVVAVTIADSHPTPQTILPTAQSTDLTDTFGCVPITVPKDSAFTGANGQLNGPTSAATFTVAPIPSSGPVACTKDHVASAFAAHPSPSGTPAAGNRFEVVAEGLNVAGAYTVTIPTAPQADDKGAVAVTFNRADTARDAFWWIFAGSVIACLVGVIGSALTGTRSKAAILATVAKARDAQNEALATIRDIRSILSAIDYESAVEAWSVVADKEHINDKTKDIHAKLALADCQARTARLIDAVNDLQLIVTYMHAIPETDRASSSLYATLLDTVLAGPGDKLDQGEPAAVAPAADIAIDALRLIDHALRTASGQVSTALNDLRAKVLSLDRSGLADQHALWDIMAEARSALALPELPTDGAGHSTQLRLLHKSMNSMNTLLWNPESGPLSLAGTVPVAILARQAIAYTSNLVNSQSFWRRARVLMELVAAIVSIGVGELVALTSQYYGHPTWGSCADHLTALTWALGAAGAVQVSKLFLTKPSITIA